MSTDLPSPFLFSFYETLPRQGPGDDRITRSILSELIDLPDKPNIIDMGSGTGHQTLILAERGNVRAVDIHTPFLNRLLDNAEKHGLSDRITVITASMNAIPDGISQVDLIWSEGAVYIIGFETGLRYWYTLVRPGGYVVVSELTRMGESPPEEAETFWRKEYPQVQSVAENCRSAESAGYRCLKTVNLPASAWIEYYAPQKEKIRVLRAGSLSPEEEQFIEEIEQEIAIQEMYPEWYGYVFYLLQRIESR